VDGIGSEQKWFNCRYGVSILITCGENGSRLEVQMGLTSFSESPKKPQCHYHSWCFVRVDSVSTELCKNDDTQAKLLIPPNEDHNQRLDTVLSRVGAALETVDPTSEQMKGAQKNPHRDLIEH